jgi:mycoredoxin
MTLKVYGANWCEDTQATRESLDRLGVPYEYIDVDASPQAKEWVKQQNGGKQRTPTLDLRGRILVEPDEPELEQALRKGGLLGSPDR